MDEQEQEELIETLRKENEVSTAQYQLLITVLLGLSLSAQLLYLVTPSKRTPIANIFPIAPSHDDSPIPLSTLLTLISIFVHLSISLYCHYPRSLFNLILSPPPKPLPYDQAFALSAVAPALALFLWKPWQTLAWWSLGPCMVYVTYTVVQAIELGGNGVAELEELRYVAPGA